MIITSAVAITSMPFSPDAAKTINSLARAQKCKKRQAHVFACFGQAYSVEQVAAQLMKKKKNNIMENGRFYGYDERDE